jgi:ComF family protein
MAKKNKSERGYNQAEVLAKFISKEINKPFNNKILKKIKKDLSQHKLTYTERREAVKGAYDINFSNYIKGKTVLICDDVITSSATLNECSRILKQHGARKVICAVIATTNKLK